MKIAILGSTGMLGNAVAKHFLNKEEHEVFLSYRNPHVVLADNTPVSFFKNSFPYDPVDPTGAAELPDVDYVINCIGTIKPFFNKNPVDSITINSIFPRQLALECQKKGIRLIHVSTDCVYSGNKGKYVESDPHDALDEYGKTKSLGEPDNCMMLRTSIIGEEIHNYASLISWVKSQVGKEVKGFTDHIWNGITTKQYGSICDQIISQDLFKEDLFHVFSKPVNKFELVSMIAHRFELDLLIKPFETGKTVDRSLSTEKDLNTQLVIPSLADQISAL